MTSLPFISLYGKLTVIKVKNDEKVKYEQQS
jgi:hypothetical protein